MTKKEILAGIAAYKEQQKEIISAIKARGGKIHQDEFDEEFSDLSRRPVTPADKLPAHIKYVDQFKPSKIWPCTMDSFILGGMAGGDWAKYLELMQLMVRAGILKQTGNTGNIVYHIK